MEIRKQLTRTLTLSAVFTGLILSGNALAQEPGKVFLEEIIVTATKRAGGMDEARLGRIVTALERI